MARKLNSSVPREEKENAVTFLSCHEIKAPEIRSLEYSKARKCAAVAGKALKRHGARPR